jgi:hypothetical protein
MIGGKIASAVWRNDSWPAWGVATTFVLFDNGVQDPMDARWPPPMEFVCKAHKHGARVVRGDPTQHVPRAKGLPSVVYTSARNQTLYMQGHIADAAKHGTDGMLWVRGPASINSSSSRAALIDIFVCTTYSCHEIEDPCTKPRGRTSKIFSLKIVSIVTQTILCYLILSAELTASFVRHSLPLSLPSRCECGPTRTVTRYPMEATLTPFTTTLPSSPSCMISS